MRSDSRTALARCLVPEMDPFLFGVFRISLGLFLCVYYFALVRDWQLFYGPNGLIYPSTGSYPGPTVFAWVGTEEDAWLLWGSGFASAMLLLLGLGRKLPVIWLWVMNFSIGWRNLGSLNSEEQILAVILFYAMFMPLNASLALHNQRGPVTVRPIGLVPLQIHLALVYVISLPWKFITDPAWLDGSALYFANRDMLFARWPYSDLFSIWGGLFSKLGTVMTLVVEASVPLFVWFSRTRLVVGLAIIGLHVAIGVFLSGVTFFSFGMAVGLLCFLPSGQLRAWLGGHRSREGDLKVAPPISGAPVAGGI